MCCELTDERGKAAAAASKKARQGSAVVAVVFSFLSHFFVKDFVLLHSRLHIIITHFLCPVKKNEQKANIESRLSEARTKNCI